MIPKGISQTSIPNPKYILWKRKQPIEGTFFVVIILKKESPVQYYEFNNFVWKYILYDVPYDDSRMAVSSTVFLYRILVPHRTSVFEIFV
jgi:hypothetical protein